MANETRFAMAAPIPLRRDYDATSLRRLAKGSNDADQTRRLLALAAVYDGGTRSAAAAIGGVGLQTVRDWVLAVQRRGVGWAGEWQSARQPAASWRACSAWRCAGSSRTGPIPAVHGVVRWRIVDLIQWVWEEFRLSISKQTMSRELRAMGFRKLSARPRHHAKDEDVAAAFKKTSPRTWRRSRRATLPASP